MTGSESILPPKPELNREENLAALLDRSQEGFIGVALNPGQLIVNRLDVPAAVAALRDRIQVVHAVDGVLDLAAGRGLRVPVGEGHRGFSRADRPARRHPLPRRLHAQQHRPAGGGVAGR